MQPVVNTGVWAAAISWVYVPSGMRKEECGVYG